MTNRNRLVPLRPAACAPPGPVESCVAPFCVSGEREVHIARTVWLFLAGWRRALVRLRAPLCGAPNATGPEEEALTATTETQGTTIDQTQGVIAVYDTMAAATDAVRKLGEAGVPFRRAT